MKLVRYGAAGNEKPGVIDADGRLRDASAVVADWQGEALSDTAFAAAHAVIADMPVVDAADAVRFGSPVGGIGKIIGIGLNYAAHAAEAGLSPPTDPIIFLKSPTALCGAFDNLILPRDSKKTDWEVELAVIIGKSGRYITEAEALSHVAGYAVANDVSERDYQLNRGQQWTKGKSSDTFAPLGPWLVTRDAVADPQNLILQTYLNDELMQTGNSSDMIFPIAQLVARVSEYMSLRPGDVMLTGTPPGVGLGKNPPRFLRPGDRLRLRIDGLGEQQMTVTSESGQ